MKITAQVIFFFFSFLNFSNAFSQAEIKRIKYNKSTDRFDLQFYQKRNHLYELESSSDLSAGSWKYIDKFFARETKDLDYTVRGKKSESMRAFFRVKESSPRDLFFQNKDNDDYEDLYEYVHPHLSIAKVDILDPVYGKRQINTLSEFNEYAKRKGAPGSLDGNAMRFIIVGIDTDFPLVYFLSMENGHHNFTRYALQYPSISKPWTTITQEEFNSVTYEGDNKRKFLTGYLIYNEDIEFNGKTGAYTMQFWPGDRVKFEYVEKSYVLISDNINLIQDGEDLFDQRFYYFPSGFAQQNLAFNIEKDKYEKSVVNLLTPNDLYKEVSYQSYVEGSTIGYLKTGTTTGVYTFRDIVLYRHIPNDISHVGGIITDSIQTPLSHILLKARQNDTPDSFVKSGIEHEKIKPFLDRPIPVKYTVTSSGFEIEEVNPVIALEYFANLRPEEQTIPESDLENSKISDLTDLRRTDAISVGAKAANLAEFMRIPEVDVFFPDFSLAVPFYFYHSFMEENHLYSQLSKFEKDKTFNENAEYRNKVLEDFRKKIEGHTIPEKIKEKVDNLNKKLLLLNPIDPKTNCRKYGIRARSSTNNEDLVGFNGAGLYESYTHHMNEFLKKTQSCHKKNEGHISKSLKQVWAGMFTFRAWDERWFFRIPHNKVFMGVLLHPNFAGETSNGVAVSKNPLNNSGSYYVNVNRNENLVTNPEKGIVPDEYLVYPVSASRNSVEGDTHEVLVIGSSDPTGKNLILTSPEVGQIYDALKKVKEYYYELENGTYQDYEIEFKFFDHPNEHGKKDAKQVFYIKQVRPWVN